jgi:hypothetical protein
LILSKSKAELGGRLEAKRNPNLYKEGYMVKRWLSLAVVLVVLTAAISCGGGGSPSTVVKNFYTALNAGDISKAQGFLSPMYMELEYTDLGELAKMGKLAGSFEKVEILGEEREEEFGEEYVYVTVEVTLSPAAQSNLALVIWGGKQTLLLEKFESGWKITYIM